MDYWERVVTNLLRIRGWPERGVPREVREAAWRDVIELDPEGMLMTWHDMTAQQAAEVIFRRACEKSFDRRSS